MADEEAVSAETPTPSPETPTPSPETPTPSPETATPSPETPTPSPETPTPSPETPTPSPTPDKPEEPTTEAVATPAAEISKGSNKSLLTIPAEPPSLKTDRYFSFTSDGSVELFADQVKVAKVPKPFPAFPAPIPPRSPRHTSTVLNDSEKPIDVPHDRPRTASMQDRLLTHIQCTGKPLFQTVLGDQKIKKTASILISGFGLRNLSSLQNALEIDDHTKLKQIYRSKEAVLSSLSLTDTSVSRKSDSGTETQTDWSASAKWEPSHKKHLMLLMGLQENDEGEEEMIKEGSLLATELPKEKEDFKNLSESMKYAQKYLRVHKIFEFFQFIIAHLLSALPENPIAFIIEILDKCLIYRAGLTEPPLLYNRKHLECLFYLMDKTRSGFIEYEQYQTGMRTVGICSYNTKPFRTHDGMIPKEDFIEEAYDCLSVLLTDMIKRRWLRLIPPVTHPPAPTPQISTIFSTSTGCDEYPSKRFPGTQLFPT